MATLAKVFFLTARCLLTVATTSNRGKRFAAWSRLEAEMGKCGK